MYIHILTHTITHSTKQLPCPAASYDNSTPYLASFFALRFFRPSLSLSLSLSVWQLVTHFFDTLLSATDRTPDHYVSQPSVRYNSDKLRNKSKSSRWGRCYLATQQRVLSLCLSLSIALVSSERAAMRGTAPIIERNHMAHTIGLQSRRPWHQLQNARTEVNNFVGLN